MIPKADQLLDLAAIPEAVRNAGFTPGEMRVVATGAFSGQPPDVRFQIRGWPSDLPAQVEGGVPPGEQRVFARVLYGDRLVLVMEAPH